MSKTGTSVRDQRLKETGVFAAVLGAAGPASWAEVGAAGRDGIFAAGSIRVSVPPARPRRPVRLPTRVDEGLVIVAHVDSGGDSTEAVRLVDSMLKILKDYLP